MELKPLAHSLTICKVAEITGGESLNSNIRLVFNNAAVGTEIAKEYFRKDYGRE